MVTVSIDLARALAWRLRRHGLQQPDAVSVADVADRVIAFRAWPPDNAGLTIAARRAEPGPAALDAALACGDVIRSYAFGGGQYVFTRETAAILLTVRTATGVWKTERWQKQGGFALDDWQPFREAVRDLLSTGPKSRTELSAELDGMPALRHLARAACGAGADALYKPLHWWGDMTFGPNREGTATFQLVDPPLEALDLDDAGRRAVRAYLHAYAPATDANIAAWLTEGLGVPRKRVHSWIADLGDDVTTVEVDRAPAYALRADVDEIVSVAPSTDVRLLPAYDPWVTGPGTADARIVPSDRRSLVSNGANLVVMGGVVAGTWKIRKGVVTVDAFAPIDEALLRAEVERLATMRGEELGVALASNA
ncbi:DNA glycosylase AlkZ-like family protein [Microbacterium sp.]|uniref:DNA glycosylase AlkZ-like family protein n=1 Tax=Microbacterium sp. TaxID=51671 RepID=UPI003F72D576